MSDDESEWSSDGSDEEDDFAPKLPQKQSVAAAAQQALPTAASSTPMPLVQKTEMPPQQFFLALPVQMFQQLSASVAPRPQVAGATIIYTSETDGWKALFYDNNKKPLFLEPLSEVIDQGTTKGKPNKGFKAPFSFQLNEGSWAQMADNLKRLWKVQFRSRNESFRFLAFLAIATFCCRAALITTPSCLVDALLGDGKSCKAKYFANTVLRAWAININSEGPNLHQPLPPHLAQFDPIFADDHSLFSCAVDGVSVAAEPPNPKGCPKELGDVLSGMKENGQRLLVLPSTSKLARTLCEGRGKEAEKACRPGWAIMLSVQVTSVSKKNKEDKGKKEKKKDKKKDKSANKIEKEEKKESKEKKKEKKSKVKKEKEVEDNSKAPTIPTPTPASSTFAPSHTPSNAASSSSRPTSLSKKPAFLDGLSDSDEEEATPKPPSKATHEQKASSTSSKTSAAGQYEGTPDSVAKALAGLKDQIDACPTTQTKILKSLVGRTFESLKDALGLDDDRVGVLRDSLLDIVAGFQKSNGTDNPGTLFNAVNANKKIQAVVAPLLQPGGPLSVQGLAPKPAVDEEMVKKYESTKKDKDSLKKEKKKLEKEKKELEKKNAALNQELATIGGKQMQLATSNIEMEEKLLKVKKDQQKLEEKAQMSEVFEQGLKQLREMLESEGDEKQKLEKQLEHLTRFQNKFKLTWIPKQAFTRCLNCKEKFSMFGRKSKHYCRHCGRMYCKDCSVMMPVPEFGFTEPVRVCQPCAKFKGFVDEDD